MNKPLKNVYLHPEVLEKMEDACKKLDVSKSLFLNVMLRELFQKADPEDLFYNRVRVSSADKEIAKQFEKDERITQ